MGTDLREFCLKWNNHHSTLISVLDSLLMKERLVDVTLAAEGQFINVHRIVLFACSQYFEDLLSQLPDKQAVVFLKDVNFVDLKALVDYMYRGEVNVSQDRLDIFLQTADALKIKGLVDQQQKKKFTASLPETFIPTRAKARMNGSKSSNISSGKYPNSVNTDESLPSPARSLSSPPMQVIEASLNQEEEPEHDEEEAVLGQEEEEEMEPGVVVAEMEPDDPFVSVNSKHDENMESEFCDDQFEATENWSYNDAEDEYWNNSQEEFNTSTNNNSNGVLETWTTPPNETAGPSRTRCKKRKLLTSTTMTSPTTRGLGGRTQAVRKDRYDPTKPFSCPKCQRRYSRKDNLQAHMRYECGQDPQFSCPLCQHKFSHRRYIQKHMLRRHPDEYEEFQKSSPSDSV